MRSRLGSTDFGVHLFRERGEFGNDLRMLLGDVGLFADLFVEVVESRFLFRLSVAVRCRCLSA